MSRGKEERRARTGGLDAVVNSRCERGPPRSHPNCGAPPTTVARLQADGVAHACASRRTQTSLARSRTRKTSARAGEAVAHRRHAVAAAPPRACPLCRAAGRAAAAGGARGVVDVASVRLVNSSARGAAAGASRPGGPHPALRPSGARRHGQWRGRHGARQRRSAGRRRTADGSGCGACGAQPHASAAQGACAVCTF